MVQNTKSNGTNTGRLEGAAFTLLVLFVLTLIVDWSLTTVQFGEWGIYSQAFCLQTLIEIHQ